VVHAATIVRDMLGSCGNQSDRLQSGVETTRKSQTADYPRVPSLAHAVSWWVRSLNSFLCLGSWVHSFLMLTWKLPSGREAPHRARRVNNQEHCTCSSFAFDVFHESTSAPFEVSQPAGVTGWTSRSRRKVRGWTRPATCQKQKRITPWGTYSIPVVYFCGFGF
jgi:hypothetical protein